jgi:diguanylate cyclase (GGDEF)-like protein
LLRSDNAYVISLRKAMDADLKESLRSALESYRTALIDVGEAGARAYPPTGENLKQSLLKLHQNLLNTVTPDAFAQAKQQVGEELKTWGDSASCYYQESADDIKNLLLQVAKAAVEVGDRDQRYSDHFQTLAGRLQGAAKLDNVSAMRQSLTSSAVELLNGVSRMTEDGKRTVEQLRAQISVYEERVEEAERLASVDPLTGVGNRRHLERQLDRRVTRTSPFFMIYLDLNEFKQINDAFGHLAGDEILKLFAGELSHSLRSTDAMGRLGGDEFVAVIDGAVGDLADRIEVIKKRVNGQYTLSTETGKRKVSVAAAVGIAVWKAGNTAQDLLRDADAAMYKDKKCMSEKKPSGLP